MSEIYYIVGIFIFISILYIEKYIGFDKLQSISDSETEEELDQKEEEFLIESNELQDIHELIEEYIIRNPDIFSRYNIKHE